jgi:hypothetical protein
MPSTTDIVEYLWGSREWLDPQYRDDDTFELGLDIALHNLRHQEDSPKWFSVAFSPDGPKMVLTLHSVEEWDRIFKGMQVANMKTLATQLIDQAGIIMEMIDRAEKESE